MRTWLAGSALLAPALAVAAPAAETVLVGEILGPEAPLYRDGQLYFVGRVSGTLSRWDGHTVAVLNKTENCSPNGLALTQRRTFLLACMGSKGAILELDMAGAELRRWATDDRGHVFDGGVNDIVVAANGGAYATVFGPSAGGVLEVAGRIVYRAPGSDAWIEVADDLDYANGIAISPDQRTLYVAQSVGNSILTFRIEPDGRLSHRANFALLNLIVPNRVEAWWLGPDGLKVDSAGNLYVAQFLGAKLLKLSPRGKLLHVFDIAAGDGVTNVALGEDERDLYVSVVTNARDPRAAGSIVRLPNVP